MEREYIIQHSILLDTYLEKAHEFDRWFDNIHIIKNFIEEEYNKLSIYKNKETEKGGEWIKVIPYNKNNLNLIIIDFGETKEIAICAKIILVIHKYPHYFTVERKNDYVYYLCEWRKNAHKTYFSVVNDNDYIVDRIEGVLKSVR